MISSRRRALGIALLAPAAAWHGILREALAAGQVETGIHRVTGDVRLNGAPARIGMAVRAGDVLSTGRDAEVVFVIGRDALLVRANARIEVQGTAGALLASGFRIVTGAMLSVFAPGEARRVQARTATVGIRGTGVYVEDLPDRTYVCTCYGIADIVAADDPAVRETVQTSHHDQPRYILAGSGSGARLVRAPVVNHSDAELILLEELVGRRPPFVERGDYVPGRY